MLDGKRIVRTDLCRFGDENFSHFANVANAKGGVLVTKSERERKICYRIGD